VTDRNRRVSYRLDDFFLPPDFRREVFRPPRLRGTFAPFFLASDRPIAIACLRLFTLPPFPPRPDLSVPFLRRRIALRTLFEAAFPYFRLPDDFRSAITGSIKKVIVRSAWRTLCQ
jgi:hypothetical protein